MEFYTRYMSIMGSLGNTMFFFQAYKIFQCQDASAVSFIGFFISFIAMVSWLVYGILLKDKPLIMANAVGTVGAILVLIGVLKYS